VLPDLLGEGACGAAACAGATAHGRKRISMQERRALIVEFVEK